MTRLQQVAFVAILFELAAVQAGPTLSAADLAVGERLFQDRVAPILERRCLHCHRGEKPKGGLSLEGADEAMSGGASGLVIVPADPAASLLWQYITGDDPVIQKILA